MEVKIWFVLLLVLCWCLCQDMKRLSFSVIDYLLCKYCILYTQYNLCTVVCIFKFCYLDIAYLCFVVVYIILSDIYLIDIHAYMI